MDKTITSILLLWLSIVSHVLAAPHGTRRAPVFRMEVPSQVSITDRTLPLTIWNMDENQVLSLEDMSLSHKRSVHGIYVSADLSQFAHVHPEDVNSNTIALPLNVSKPGLYMLVVGFTLKDCAACGDIQVVSWFEVMDPERRILHPAPQTQNRTLNWESISSGYPLSTDQKLARSIDVTKTEPGLVSYRVELQPESRTFKAGQCQTVYVVFKSLQDSQDLELQPYLGAAAHIAVIREDLAWAGHVHAVVPKDNSSLCGHMHHNHETIPNAFPGRVAMALTFPEAAYYRVYVQVATKSNTMVMGSFGINVISS